MDCGSTCLGSFEGGYHYLHYLHHSLLLLLSRFSHVRPCVTPQTAATRLCHPLDPPGKNTGVGCHFLLQCMKVKSESEIAQSCPTLRDPMDCSLPGSSIHGIFQARVLQWVTIAFSATIVWPQVNSRGESLELQGDPTSPS